MKLFRKILDRAGYGFVLGLQLSSPAQQPAKPFGLSGAHLRFEVPETQIEGILIERKVFGPPGYGETPAKDARDTILIVKLSHPISVRPAVDAEATGSASLDPAVDISEVQLFGDRSSVSQFRKLLGLRIIATGTLEESITASQYTKVFMDVQSLVRR